MAPQQATWVFGYGSLIWRQDFPFLEARQAHIEGWSRRFWQGSHDHRGVPDAPGRVVTLIRSSGERCTGRAFLVEEPVFEHLDHREKNGYARHDLDIHFSGGAVPGVTYIAPPGNEAFLGEAPLDHIAAQIRQSAGPSGRNIDYLLHLAAALRELGVKNDHVYAVEQALG